MIHAVLQLDLFLDLNDERPSSIGCRHFPMKRLSIFAVGLIDSTTEIMSKLQVGLTSGLNTKIGLDSGLTYPNIQ